MFKAILIFVLLWSTAMADIQKRNKEIARVRKELKSLVRKDKRYNKQESLKKAKLYQKLKDLGVPSKFGNYWINTFLKPKSVKSPKSGHQREMNVQEDQMKRGQIRDLITKWFKSKGKKVPSLQKGKGFVTSTYRPFASKQGHRKYGGVDFAAAGLGTKQEQQDFINFAIENGYTVIDEKFAISQSRRTGDRGVFHIDKRPGKGRLIQEIPDTDKSDFLGEGKFRGKAIGRYTTVKPGEESYGGFIAPGATPKEEIKEKIEVKKEVKDPQTDLRKEALDVPQDDPNTRELEHMSMPRPSGDQPVDIMTKESFKVENNPIAEREILDEVISEKLKVAKQATPPAPVELKDGGEVKKYENGGIAQKLTMGEGTSGVEEEEEEEKEVIQPEIKQPERDQETFQKDVLAIQSHLDDAKKGDKSAKQRLSQYDPEFLKEFRDTYTTKPVPKAPMPEDRKQVGSAIAEAGKKQIPDTATVVQDQTFTEKVQEQGDKQAGVTDYFDEIFEKDRKLNEAMQGELQKISDIEKNIKQVEPNRFFHSMSTPSKIIAAIGMLAAGAAAQTPEAVLGVYKIMDSVIQQDIQNQKLDREHQIIVAKEARSRAQDIIDRYSKLRMSPDTKAKLMQLKAKLEQDKNVLATQQQKEMLKKLIRREVAAGRAASVPAEWLPIVFSEKELGRMDAMRSSLEKERKEAKIAPIIDAYRRMNNLITNKKTFTGADDIAIVFQFMKTLDPNSVVREGEFKTAEGAGPRATQFARAWNKFYTGGRFAFNDRKAFLGTVKNLVQPALDSDKFIKTKYLRMAKRYGYPPALIVTPSISWEDLPGGKDELQIQRVMKRKGLTRDEAEKVIESYKR